MFKLGLVRDILMFALQACWAVLLFNAAQSWLRCIYTDISTLMQHHISTLNSEAVSSVTEASDVSRSFSSRVMEQDKHLKEPSPHFWVWWHFTERLTQTGFNLLPWAPESLSALQESDQPHFTSVLFSSSHCSCFEFWTVLLDYSGRC